MPALSLALVMVMLPGQAVGAAVVVLLVYEVVTARLARRRWRMRAARPILR